MRQLPESDYLRIKALFKRLVAKCGGCELAATITRVEKTSLSDYGRSARPDLFPPADVIMDLETEVGEPLVSREMRRIVGVMNCRPKPMREHEIVGEGAKVTVCNGDFQKRAIEALEDGVVDDRELQDLIDSAQTKMRAAIALHDKLCALQQSRRGCVTLDVARREREGAA